MTKLLDAKALGLPARTKIESLDQNSLAIVVNRKSRIILVDGKRILAQAEKISSANPGCKVILKTTAPVCGKTLQYLAEHGISVLQV